MSEESYQKIFSKNLNYYMALNDKNQTDLVYDLGFNKSAVSTWCNGTRLPRMDKVEMLARYFGINRSDLIEEKSETDYYLNEETAERAHEMGEKIYNLRIQKGLTLEELGHMVGVGKSTVRKWENGMIANMKRDKILKVSEALGTIPAYLMGWEDKEPPKKESDSGLELYGIVGKMFREIREEKGFSLTAVSEYLQIAPISLQKYESGERKIKMGTIKELCIFYKIEYDDFIKEAKLKFGRNLYTDNSSKTEEPSSKIMRHYNQLNDLGKHEAEKRVEELTYIPQYTHDLKASYNDFENEPREIEKMREDLSNLKRPDSAT